MVRGYFSSWFLLVAVWSGLVSGQSIQPAAFVSNNVGDSITSFTINPDGTLEFAFMVPTADSPQAIAITPNGRYLAVAHGTSSDTVEQLRIFEVFDDASMSQVLSTFVPDSPLNARWLSDDILAVTETSLSGDNNLISYRFDPKAGTLTIVDSVFTGDFSYSLAVARGGSLVYANNTFGDASINAISADIDGNLTSLEMQIVEPVFAVAVDASPDGNFLYGAGGISGTGGEILGFEIDDDGLLSPIAGAQSPGSSPKVIDMTEDGTVLVAGHGTDATIQSFLRDTKSGTLIPTGFSYDVGSQGNLGDLVVMGDLLLVTDESTTDDGLRGLLSLRIQNDGSLTVISPAVDTGGSRPEYIAAWPGLIQVLLGDVNQDGVVDLLDVAPFVALLENGDYQVEGDINEDGSVDLLDVALFVDLLTG